MFRQASKHLLVFTLAFSSITLGRKWRDSGVGTIVFEEAWTIPELAFQTGNKTTGQSTPLKLLTLPCNGIDYELSSAGTNADLIANLLDIHNQRFEAMNTNNIDFMVLSCAEPCIQGISDPVSAANMAVTVNNRLASDIANNTERFGGFASLAMHNATVAALELKRAVKELGFLGALINDYQQSGPDGQTLLYYDQPEYDVFWEMVTDLDVPVYFHPRNNIPAIVTFEYAHAPFLIGPAQEFAVTLSTHILGLCTNGVFDRFPKLNIIIGHLGERISSDLLRIDTQLLKQIPQGIPMKKNVTTYFHTNIFETTSGNFATDLLKFHIGQIGLDRIMYSIDYPFVNIPDGTVWVNSLDTVLNERDLIALKRGRAIEVLRLND